MEQSILDGQVLWRNQMNKTLTVLAVLLATSAAFGSEGHRTKGTRTTQHLARTDWPGLGRRPHGVREM